MIDKLQDKELIVQPNTGFVCTLLAKDTPDPANPDFALEDGTYVWGIVVSDSRAPQNLIGELIVQNLTEEAMLNKLQSENWNLFSYSR